MILYILVALIVIVAVVVLARVLRPKPDPVDSFRRQIDALSPEARRPTIDIPINHILHQRVQGHTIELGALVLIQFHVTT